MYIQSDKNILLSSTVICQFFQQVDIDWEKIEAKIQMEYQKEREQPAPTTTAPSGGRTGATRGR